MKNFATKLLTVSTIMILFLGTCKQAGTDKQPGVAFDYPFRNPELSIEERIEDLVSRLTLDEKVSQMMYDADAIPRLDIPAYNWWNECLHGIARSAPATIFPQAIGMAATFDNDLIYRISSVISDEARAIFHSAVARDNRSQYMGLTFWTPNINIFRDPRWGRGQETYGEDPYLTASLATSFVKGLQDDHPDYMKAAACAKHYAVHSGPEKDRHTFNAEASLKDMFETYLPAFKALVDAGVEGVMCAYNRTNGEACCGSSLLLQDILRDQWQFEGYITSDCWALRDFHEGHLITGSEVESAALALKSGVNLNCGDIYPYLIQAVEQGLVAEEEINRSLSVLLRTRFKLGLFDPAEGNPHTKISKDVIDSDKHRKLAREAAIKSMVLLKNNNVLPLGDSLNNIFITGPNAGNLGVLMGNYYGVNGNMSTILEGIASKVDPAVKVQYKQGVMLDRENINPIDWTTGYVKQADAVIAVMGISGLLEGEEGESLASSTKGDRFDLNLPKNQLAFLKKLRSSYDKPLIVVITGGSPITMPEVHELADAILWVWYPGEEGGNAVGDILFGDAVPSGRLPVTFPVSIDQLPPYTDYSMKGRTYRYMEEKPLYPFGFGLSYTIFEYDNIVLDKNEIAAGDSVEVKVDVKNTGTVRGEEVVQLYITDTEASVAVPAYALKGFQRIALEPGEYGTLTFTVTPGMYSIVDDHGNSIIEAGEFRVTVGGSSPGKRSDELGAAKSVNIMFSINS